MSLSAPKLAEVQGSLARLNRVAVVSVALFVFGVIVLIVVNQLVAILAEEHQV